MKIQKEVIIEVDQDIAFEWIANQEKAKKWQNNITSTTMIKEPDEIIGTEFREIVSENGNDLEMLGRITEYKRNERISFHLESRVHQFDVKYYVNAEKNKSRVIVVADIKWLFPINIIALINSKKMSKGIGSQLETELEKLKECCEKNK